MVLINLCMEINHSIGKKYEEHEESFKVFFVFYLRSNESVGFMNLIDFFELNFFFILPGNLYTQQIITCLFLDTRFLCHSACRFYIIITVHCDFNLVRTTLNF
jgi:hypothetical protein